MSDNYLSKKHFSFPAAIPKPHVRKLFSLYQLCHQVWHELFEFIAYYYTCYVPKCIVYFDIFPTFYQHHVRHKCVPRLKMEWKMPIYSTAWSTHEDRAWYGCTFPRIVRKEIILYNVSSLSLHVRSYIVPTWYIFRCCYIEIERPFPLSECLVSLYYIWCISNGVVSMQ